MSYTWHLSHRAHNLLIRIAHGNGPTAAQQAVCPLGHKGAEGGHGAGGENAADAPAQHLDSDGAAQVHLVQAADGGGQDYNDYDDNDYINEDYDDDNYDHHFDNDYNEYNGDYDVLNLTQL